ncbi:ABC transporter permease subunit [Paenibacillus typhae]|uniref:ABC-2 type transport system permease protein n=1 Tax=Paenibacillus typhae TaxID=1174501 RepID=A0A1G8GN40_9BACL|nr:ABC transporter permease subunit [Paenibacillus typhae]SDH95773.1 ABC-2 type transport system permease protein [Paenibacillus typhae]
MSWALFKANLRVNRFLWLLIVAVYSFYSVVLVSMFNLDSVDELKAMLDLLPAELMNAIGMNFGSTLLTFLSGTLYSILLYLFPMILSVVINHRLIAVHVDKGSMAYLLSTSNSRIRIAMTQAVYSLISITAIFCWITVLTLIATSAMFPGLMDTKQFILLNLYALLMYYTINGICFLASCLANEARYSIGLGAGLPIMFVLFQMLGDSGERLEWLSYFSLFTLFEPERLFAGDSFAYIGMAVFAGLAVVLYILGILYFNKKDLPI